MRGLRQRKERIEVPPTTSISDESKTRSKSSSATSLLWGVLMCVAMSFQLISTLYSEYVPNPNDAGNYWEPLHYLLYGTGVMNWEWNPSYALRSPLPIFPLYAIGYVLKPFCSAEEVFYVARISIGIFGISGCYFLGKSIGHKHGEYCGLFTFFFLTFLHQEYSSLNLLSLDNLMAIVSMWILGFWVQDRFQWLILFLCTFNTFLRLNFAVVAAFIALDMSLRINRRNVSFFHRVFRVGFMVAASVLFWGLAFWLFDSLWFQRPTFSFLNHLWFNVIENKSHLFGSYQSPYYYFDILLREQNCVIVAFALFGIITSLIVRDRTAILFIPFAISFLYVQRLIHKQDRFLFFLYPVLCFYASLFLTRIGKSLGNRNLLKWSISGIVIVYFSLSGLSLLTLDHTISKNGHNFFKSREAVTDLGTKPVCLANYPWSSWYLHDSCSKFFFVEISNEFWKGLNAEQFQRFENFSENALLVAANHTKLYKDRKSPWFDEDDLSVYLASPKEFDWAKLIKQNRIERIFLTGGIPINERMGNAINEHGVLLRHPTPTTKIVFSEMMLGDYLKENFEIAREEKTLIHRYDVPRLDREFGLWWFGSGLATMEGEQTIQYTYWRKRK